MCKIRSKRRSRLHERSAFCAAAQINRGCCRGHRLVCNRNVIVINIGSTELSVEKRVEVLDHRCGVCAFENRKSGNGRAGSDGKWVLLNTDTEKVTVSSICCVTRACEQRCTTERRNTIVNIDKRLQRLRYQTAAQLHSLQSDCYCAAICGLKPRRRGLCERNLDIGQVKEGAHKQRQRMNLLHVGDSRVQVIARCFAVRLKPRLCCSAAFQGESDASLSRTVSQDAQGHAAEQGQRRGIGQSRRHSRDGLFRSFLGTGCLVRGKQVPGQCGNTPCPELHVLLLLLRSTLQRNCILNISLEEGQQSEFMQTIGHRCFVLKRLSV